MTTTLRPTGPLQQESGGARRRGYEICVNSRPAGTVEIAVLPGTGGRTGAVRRLAVAEGDRRRGRGTVAALAAEEVLRAWRCDRIEVSVTEGAEAAARLVASLGYTAYARRLEKPLGGPPEPPPPGLVIRPMDAAGRRHWWPEAVAGHAAAWTAAGVPPEAARSRAEEAHRALLPGGPHAPPPAGVRLESLFRGGRPAGFLLLGTRRTEEGDPAAYVYDIGVVPEERGQGRGRALLLHAERLALADGHRRIALRVFTGNTPALRLYASLGYRVTATELAKPLI
jgi:ribosomal protein S18 acetylase RimI-like enzyme